MTLAGLKPHITKKDHLKRNTKYSPERTSHACPSGAVCVLPKRSALPYPDFKA